MSALGSSNHQLNDRPGRTAAIAGLHLVRPISTEAV
jgi:hypothetical protein